MGWILRWSRPLSWLMCAALFAFSFFADRYTQYIVNLVLIYVVVCIGLNMLLGYAGQFAFAHAALMGIGAYATSLLVAPVGLSFWIALPLAGLVTALCGALIAFPAMRISRVYLALLTLGVAQLVVWVLINWRSVTGGVDGVELKAPWLFGWRVRGDQNVFYVLFVTTIILYALARRILESKLGRSFVTIRENEIVAACNGIDVARTKIIVFALSGLYAGIGGGLFALALGFIVPESFGVVQVTLQFSVVVLGGLMSLPGVVIGAILLTVLPEALRGAQAWQEIIYGLLLMVVVLVMPNGIAGLMKRYGLLPKEVLAHDWRRFARGRP